MRVSFITLAVAFLLNIQPSGARAQELTGIWEVDGFTHAYGAFTFFVDVKRRGSNWVATKLNSSRYVPIGNTHFTGRIEGDHLNAQVQVALAGFSEPEWRTHTFNLARDSSGKVIRIELASGETHVTGPDAEKSITDRWVYRRWPSGQFRLLGPKVVDWGYRNASSIRQGDLRDVEDSLRRWRQHLEESTQRFNRALADYNEKHGVRLARQAAYENAWTEAVRVRARVGTDEAVDTTGMPSRLRGLYRMLEAEKASIKRAEQIILDHQNGVATQTADSIAALFSGIDSSRAQIRQLQTLIDNARREAGLGPEPDREQGQRADARAAEQRYRQSIDPYYEARRVESRARTEMDLARGQVELAQREIEENEARKQELEADIKRLADRGQLVRVEGFIQGDPSRLVYQAVPNGLDEDLRGLREVMKEVHDLLKSAEAQRNSLRESFKEKFDEGTRLRDEVRELIWDNALEMAGAHAVTKTLEFGIAFGTGGPAGLAIEMVTTPIFQNAFYESRGDINGPTDIITNGGVIFSNYDESGLRNAYRNALRDSAAGEPDPADACRDLNLQIKQDIERRRFDAISIDTKVAEGFRSVPSGQSGYGNPNQRIQSNTGHYALVTMSQVEQELLGDLATRMNILQNGYLEAEQALASRVAARAALAGQEGALRELAGIDARIASAGLSHAERMAALAEREALIGRLTAESPDLAAELAEQTARISRRLNTLRGVQTLAEQGATAGERAAAQNRVEALLRTITQEQAASQSALRRAASNINWGRALSHQADLTANLTRELGKLARFEQTVARLGLRNSVKGSAVSVATSLFFAVANDFNQSRLQAQEEALWHRIFAAEMEQSLRLKAWQRASCIYWALYDQFYELRQFYTNLYRAYDPETGFQLLQNDPIRDHESFDLRLIYEPVREHRLEAKLGDVACPETTRNGCQVPAGGLSGEKGPYLPIDVVIYPRE